MCLSLPIRIFQFHPLTLNTSRLIVLRKQPTNLATLPVVQSRREALSVNDTRRKVREVITRQFGIEPQLLTDSTTLDDLGADSMAIVELMVNLEEVFESPMPDVSAANINTVGDIIAFIEGNNASAPPDAAREASL